MSLKLTPQEIERYRPYHDLTAFKLGFDAYMNGRRYDGISLTGANTVTAQAYDRGAECAMRRQKETSEKV